MVAVDAIVVYIQSTPNFPSWTSRVRSPSPALRIKKLEAIHGFSVTAITALRDVVEITTFSRQDRNLICSSPSLIIHRRFQLAHRCELLSEAAHGVLVFIHIDGIAHLSRPGMSINPDRFR
jgi:hypothetical protein